MQKINKVLVLNRVVSISLLEEKSLIYGEKRLIGGMRDAIIGRHYGLSSRFVGKNIEGMINFVFHGIMLIVSEDRVS